MSSKTNMSDPAIEPCDLCAGRDFKQVAMENGHRIWRCRSCGLVQVRPLPVQTGENNQAYWQVDLEDPALRKSRLGSREVYVHGLSRMAAASGETIEGKRVLDVGCGMGIFLELVREQGGVPHGIDISPEAAEITRRLGGIDSIRVGEFETSDLPAESVQVVTGWNVLEHTRSPRRWLVRAHQLLEAGGLLLVKVPNVRFSSIASRLTPALRKLGVSPSSYLATKPPLHLYGFSETSLRRLLEAASFEVLSVESARIRESSGRRGRMVAAAASVMTGLTAGRAVFHPVIMAVARKPNTRSGA
jgi:2-polyprenyl-3-methyl-5-hydroxy-6-metoxy-1,4-benzoquinol methylase